MFLMIYKIIKLSLRRSETEKIQKSSFFAAKISINKRLIIIIWAYKNIFNEKMAVLQHNLRSSDLLTRLGLAPRHVRQKPQ